MTLITSMLNELEQEADTTRRVLERVPDDQLGWKPHPKARTLGELALHVATVPGAVASIAVQSDVQRIVVVDASPSSAAELLSALSESISTAKRVLGDLDDAALAAHWRMLDGERVMVDLPRGAFLRAIMLNHWYHHRGQLTTYLRTLGQPIPSIYGPSADEVPF